MTEHAFPDPHRTDIKGMTLRDYFAAKAMADMTWTYKAACAIECYAIADAMMKERENDTSTR